MKKRKSALKYFVHLIKFGELVKRREAFHRHYASRARADKYVRYDAEAEQAEFEEMTLDFAFVDRVVNFGHAICAEVTTELKKAKSIIYGRLTSGLLTEQEVFCHQVTRDIEELTHIVAEQQVFGKYPYIASALLDIKELIVAHQPLSPRQGGIDMPKPVVEPVVSFHYRCFEEGSSEENKPLTRHLLGNLYIGLRDKLELIAPNTSIEDFRAVFSGKVVANPVVWTGANNQLHHFIKTIGPKLIPLGHKKLNKKWVTAAACFVNRDGGVYLDSQLQNPGIKTEKVHRGREIGDLVKLLR